jgi:hypothetical protein
MNNEIRKLDEILEESDESSSEYDSEESEELE